MELVELLEQLTAPAGVTGMEGGAADVAAKLLEERGLDVSRNCRGSVIGKLEGQGPRILLDAHLDQVGFAWETTEMNVDLPTLGKPSRPTSASSFSSSCSSQSLFESDLH